MQPRQRIDAIEDHVRRARYLDGSAAREFAIITYLDEQAGFCIEPNHPLRLAEQAAGIEPLEQP